MGSPESQSITLNSNNIQINGTTNIPNLRSAALNTDNISTTVLYTNSIEPSIYTQDIIIGSQLVVGGVQIGSGTTGLIKLLAERIELFGNIDIVNLNTDYIDSTRIFVNNLSTNTIEPSVPSADLIFGSELTSGALRIGSDTSRTVLVGTTNASVVNISTANI
jgi:hypothetical protein